jgi:hypothetical protein
MAAARVPKDAQPEDVVKLAAVVAAVAVEIVADAAAVVKVVEAAKAADLVRSAARVRTDKPANRDKRNKRADRDKAAAVVAQEEKDNKRKAQAPRAELRTDKVVDHVATIAAVDKAAVAVISPRVRDKTGDLAVSARPKVAVATEMATANTVASAARAAISKAGKAQAVRRDKNRRRAQANLRLAKKSAVSSSASSAVDSI